MIKMDGQTDRQLDQSEKQGQYSGSLLLLHAHFASAFLPLPLDRERGRKFKQRVCYIRSTAHPDEP